MKCGLTLVLLALGAVALQADELHLRDGTVISGVYAGGSQKEVYFQRSLVGTEVYPLIMVESVKFGASASVPPGASLQTPPSGPPQIAPADTLKAPAATLKAPAATLKWFLALFLPTRSTVQLTATSH